MKIPEIIEQEVEKQDTSKEDMYDASNKEKITLEQAFIEFKENFYQVNQLVLQGSSRLWNREHSQEHLPQHSTLAPGAHFLRDSVCPASIYLGVQARNLLNQARAQCPPPNSCPARSWVVPCLY